MRKRVVAAVAAATAITSLAFAGPAMGAELLRIDTDQGLAYSSNGTLEPLGAAETANSLCASGVPNLWSEEVPGNGIRWEICAAD